MCNFITQTLTEPSVFWTALEALATVFALYFIFIEVKRSRRENTEKKIEGLKFAAERLEAEDFRLSIEIIKNAIIESPKEFPKGISAELITVFARLDFISKLIKLEYIDQETLLLFKSTDLLYLERYITNLENREKSEIPDLKSSYPGGYNLLKAAARFKS